MVTRAATVVTLLAVFVRGVVAGGVATTWLILGVRRRPAPALVRMTYGNLTPAGAALLAALVSLTPGTSAIDLDPERRTLLLHLLDGRDPETAVAAIRRHFERRLEVLFPEASS